MNIISSCYKYSYTLFFTSENTTHTRVTHKQKSCIFHFTFFFFNYCPSFQSNQDLYSQNDLNNRTSPSHGRILGKRNEWNGKKITRIWIDCFLVPFHKFPTLSLVPCVKSLVLHFFSFSGFCSLTCEIANHKTHKNGNVKKLKPETWGMTCVGQNIKCVSACLCFLEIH